MTSLLIISGLIGAVIAGVCIGMERAGFWQPKYTLPIILVAGITIGVLWHLYLWKCNIFKLSYVA